MRIDEIIEELKWKIRNHINYLRLINPYMASLFNRSLNRCDDDLGCLEKLEKRIKKEIVRIRGNEEELVSA